MLLVFVSDSCIFCYICIWSCFLAQKESYITLRDLKGSKLSGDVFNMLFNLNKSIAFETHDLLLIPQVLVVWYLNLLGGGGDLITFQKCQKRKQECENHALTEWERFAHREYTRLSMEDSIEWKCWGLRMSHWRLLLWVNRGKAYLGFTVFFINPWQWLIQNS